MGRVAIPCAIRVTVAARTQPSAMFEKQDEQTKLMEAQSHSSGLVIESLVAVLLLLTID